MSRKTNKTLQASFNPAGGSLKELAPFIGGAGGSAELAGGGTHGPEFGAEVLGTLAFHPTKNGEFVEAEIKRKRFFRIQMSNYHPYYSKFWKRVYHDMMMIHGTKLKVVIWTVTILQQIPKNLHSPVDVPFVVVPVSCLERMEVARRSPADASPSEVPLVQVPPDASSSEVLLVQARALDGWCPLVLWNRPPGSKQRNKTGQVFKVANKFCDMLGFPTNQTSKQIRKWTNKLRK